MKNGSKLSVSDTSSGHATAWFGMFSNWGIRIDPNNPDVLPSRTNRLKNQWKNTHLPKDMALGKSAAACHPSKTFQDPPKPWAVGGTFYWEVLSALLSLLSALVCWCCCCCSSAQPTICKALPWRRQALPSFLGDSRPWNDEAHEVLSHWRTWAFFAPYFQTKQTAECISLPIRACRPGGCMHSFTALSPWKRAGRKDQRWCG